MNTLDFRGTGKLTGFYLRQGWITRSIWLFTPALLIMSAMSSYGSMFASQFELNAFVDDNVLNPAVSAIHGFILSKDIQGIVAWNVKTVSLIVIAIFNILAVSKIMRGEEESGRADLLGSGVVGRQSLFAVSITISFATNVVMGILMFLTMLLYGLPADGSLTLSLLMIVGGCLFASFGAVASQLASAKRTASSLGIGLMGLFYVLSFMNNLSAGNNPSSYFTPFRWFFIVRPFAGNHLAFLLVAICLVVIIVALALYLSSKRDVGAGVIHPKAGRSDASPGFNNVFALSWRMHRGLLIVWTIALGIFAFGIGSVDSLVSKMLGEQQTLASWMSLFGEPEKAFLSLMVYVLCLFVSAYGILAVQKIRSEETDGRIEALLSTPMKRSKWMASHILFSTAGSTLILLVIGLCIAIGSVVSGGSVSAFIEIVLMAIVKLPAVLTMAGIAVLLFGLLPKLSVGLSWAIYSLFILIQLLWEMALIPDIIFLLSPFGQVYPTQSLTFATFMLLLAAACVLYGAGLLCFKKRDIQA
jgi:ABC-2 type transport system permease protein